MQPDFSEHRLVWFGLGAALAMQSSSSPLSQATSRVCSPWPHWLEHSDHSLAAHLQPDVSRHGSSPAGAAPELSWHSSALLPTHLTSLVRVPLPQVLEHADHPLAFHAQPSKSAHLRVSFGRGDLWSQNSSAPLAQVTLRRCSPSPQLLSHGPHSSTCQVHLLVSVHLRVSGGTVKRTLKQSWIWLFVQSTSRCMLPSPHSASQGPQSPAIHWQPLYSLHVSFKAGWGSMPSQSSHSPLTQVMLRCFWPEPQPTLQWLHGPTDQKGATTASDRFSSRPAARPAADSLGALLPDMNAAPSETPVGSGWAWAHISSTTSIARAER
mmetsp:Transcript_44100/g.117010  ORF Transcript_44100/g.117010 Transcript_44100/m.117010 type:complete len:323 (-) Transcript_44100:40-1008(-)